MPPVNLLIGEAALALGVSESTLRRLANAGVLDVPRVGGYRAFPADRLDEYRGRIASRRGHPRTLHTPRPPVA